MASLRSRRTLRPVGFDELGLRRAISDRMLPFLVAAMAFLAALALAGWVGAASLARHWQQGAGSEVTVQVPRPREPAAQGGGARLDRVLALLAGTPGIASARALSDEELGELLRPWLGSGAERLAVPLPAVIAVRLADADLELGRLARRLDEAAPGTLVESHGVWIRRLSVLARSLQACAGLALLLVAAVAAAVIAVATRAGLAARREAIEIVHGLGATDGYIAARFAGRATLLAATGGIAGAVLALPVLLTLANLAAPFAGGAAGSDVAGRRPGRCAGCAMAHASRHAGRRGGDRLPHRPGHGAPLAAPPAMTRRCPARDHRHRRSRSLGARDRLAAAASPGSCIWRTRPGQAPAHTDGIVAFTGGPERVETALRLLAEDHADRLLLSGIGGGAELAELAHRAGVDPLPLAAASRSTATPPRHGATPPRPPTGRARTPSARCWS